MFPPRTGVSGLDFISTNRHSEESNTNPPLCTEHLFLLQRKFHQILLSFNSTSYQEFTIIIYSKKVVNVKLQNYKIMSVLWDLGGSQDMVHQWYRTEDLDNLDQVYWLSSGRTNIPSLSNLKLRSLTYNNCDIFKNS